MIARAAGRLASALAFGAAIAAFVIVVGVDDMESYEHAFFSLDRGTALQTIRVLGHPVYTLGIGLGVRLPLHGSLGGSPAAALAPLLPPPVTYALLITFAVAAAVMVVRHALEPLCGRLVSWLAVVLLFCSVPMVNYTIYADWPETAVTYCAVVACVFAPHAMLALLGSLAARRRWAAGLSLAVLVWALIAGSHPGYWSMLGASLALSSLLLLLRAEHPMTTRQQVIALLGVASFLAVLPQAPDIGREIEVARAAGATGMTRFAQGSAGELLRANMFPLGELGERMPFTFLAMALLSLLIGFRLPADRRRSFIAGSVVISMAFGAAAATLPAGTSIYTPSSTWMLRDPALVFAVLAGACAAGGLRTSQGRWRRGTVLSAATLLALASLQGLAYAGNLVAMRAVKGDRASWTQNLIPTAQAPSRRGLDTRRVPPGNRLALWPGVREKMRAAKRASTDFADAGYPLVTAWTKQRTMVGLIVPNEFLFNQFTDLEPDVLCNPDAVAFLQLRYLLVPPDAPCAPWTRVAGVIVDDGLEVRAATDRDDRVRALKVDDLGEGARREPALSAHAALIATSRPLSGTAVRLGTRNVAIQLSDAATAAGQALLLPVAYDAAWRASSGHVESVGGLVALIGVDQPRVTLEFAPDAVALARAISMTVAQILAVIGFLGLACADLR